MADNEQAVSTGACNLQEPKLPSLDAHGAVPGKAALYLAPWKEGTGNQASLMSIPDLCGFG